MITVKSPAKLNWYLRVCEPRPDGFHDLETIFQELEIVDDLTFTHTDDDQCSIDGFPPDVSPETNLITRAWQLLKQHYPKRVSGVHCQAVKRLPRGGGLGGGSSNGAAALRTCNDLFGLQLSPDDLEILGAELGSDVPFFIRGGCAIGTGRGEKLEPLPPPPPFNIVLLFPSQGMPTSEAFARLDSLSPRPLPSCYARDLIPALQTGDPHQLAPLIYNDFEIAVKREPWFHEGHQALLSAGCITTFLCGSGSTIAGLAENPQDALEIEQVVKKGCPINIICTRSLAR